MPSSYSTRLLLEKQGTNENNNTWGTRLNDSVIEMIDEAVGGVTTIAFGTTAGDCTITNTNGASAQGRYATLVLTGAPVSNVALNVPAKEKVYNIRSKHTGSNWIKIRPTGAVLGAEVTITPGNAAVVYTDGNRMHKVAEVAQASQINSAMLPLVQASTTAAARAVLSVPDIATKAQVTSAAASNSAPTTQQTGIAILHGFKKYTDTSGAANTITMTCNPVPVSYTEIESLYVRVANTNTSTTVNINCNVLGNIRVKKHGLSGYADPAIGDIRAGQFYEFTYDATSNVFVLMNPIRANDGLNSYTEETTPKNASDYLYYYNTSTGTERKVTPNNLFAQNRFIGSFVTWSASGLITQAHGLGVTPNIENCSAILKNDSGATLSGWANQESFAAPYFWTDSGGSYGLTVYADGTNVYARIGPNGLVGLNKTTGVAFTLTSPSWKIALTAKR